MVHACQAMVFSDLALEVEPLPPVARVSGTLTKLSELAEDIVEVTIEPSQRLDMLPGQYCRFRFRGFPARSFSPTSSLGALQSDGRIRLHVKRVRGGRVTQTSEAQFVRATRSTSRGRSGTHSCGRGSAIVWS